MFADKPVIPGSPERPTGDPQYRSRSKDGQRRRNRRGARSRKEKVEPAGRGVREDAAQGAWDEPR